MSPAAIRIVAIIALLPFTALTAQAFIAEGVLGFPTAIALNLTSLQVFLDLVIAVVFWGVWVLVDARAAGRNGWGWVLSALVVGCFSPLMYMVVHRRWPGSPMHAAEPGAFSSGVRALVGAVFVAFAALTIAALAVDGLDVPATIQASWANMQIWVDLAIALVLWMGWLLADCRARGGSPVGWLILTLVLGSFGPLLYAVVHRRWPASHPVSAATPG